VHGSSNSKQQDMKRKLFHWKNGFLGLFTNQEGEKIMSVLGGCFKWDFPFTSADLWITTAI
jgi:hypothetical protein